MKKTTETSNSSQSNIDLVAIKEKYKQIFAANSLLNEKLEKIIEFNKSPGQSDKRSFALLENMFEEVCESINDESRISDESPNSNKRRLKNEETYLSLKRDLEIYKNNFLYNKGKTADMLQEK